MRIISGSGCGADRMLGSIIYGTVDISVGRASLSTRKKEQIERDVKTALKKSQTLLTITMAVGLVLLSTPAVAAHASSFKDAAILPGDRIVIEIFRHDKMSGTMDVTADTSVQHPVLGKIPLAGKTIEEAEQMLSQLISNLNIDTETFTIMVQIKAAIMGEVRSPGIYYLNTNNSLNDLLALSGGITTNANLKKVIIFNSNRYERLDFLAHIENGDIEDIYIRSGDTVLIPVKRTLADSINMISTLVSTIAIIVSMFLLK